MRVVIDAVGADYGGIRTYVVQLLDAWQHDVRKLFEAMCKDKPEMETCKVMNAVPPAEQKN